MVMKTRSYNKNEHTNIKNFGRYLIMEDNKPIEGVTLNCMVCGKEFIGEEPKMCCSGRECGCMGLPIDPIVCSEECYDNLPFRNNNK